MKRYLRDTIFIRLFAMIMAAIFISHLATFALMSSFFQDRGGPIQPPPEAIGFRHFVPAPSALMPAPPPPHHSSVTVRPPPPGLWIGLVTQLLTMTLAAWFGARILVRPIQRIGNAAEKIGEDLTGIYLEEEGPYEARRSAQIFNRMQDRIRAHIQERGRFLAAVSHDLRTPLTRMRLRMENASENINRSKLLADIDEMSHLLDSTLDYMRGDALNESEQLLDIQALAETMAENAREQGHDVDVSGSASPIMTHPLALRRCLSNVLENAIRYGNGAHIHLSESERGACIEVKDSGPGIPPDKIELVFEPFVRLEHSRNKGTGGVGLGLAIARDAIKRCGGELKLLNAATGGLSATLCLPKLSPLVSK